MIATARYKLADLYAVNREHATRFKETWSSFRYMMRGTMFGREEMNNAYEFYRKGWYHALKRAGLIERD